MKNLRNMLALAGCITVLGLSTGSVAAQGRGNFDPAQIQQQMMERIREQMDVKDDAEWKVLEGAITKVTEAQREVGFGGGGLGRLFGGGNRNRGNGGGDNANNNNNNGGDLPMKLSRSSRSCANRLKPRKPSLKKRAQT